jgi:hypothetical protein
MKKALVLAAVSEAATGAALLVMPSLVGRLNALERGACPGPNLVADPPVRLAPSL